MSNAMFKSEVFNLRKLLVMFESVLSSSCSISCLIFLVNGLKVNYIKYNFYCEIK